ncbi:MAG: helix-turn-helix transcriptional regulator [Chloroflexi bacterium]|nr:helix-turn-helix transcriptional regulator [Chloroflexota bacterium]
MLRDFFLANVLREFLLAFIHIHILYHASKAPVFAAEIAEELARHGYAVGLDTVYRILQRLAKEGYLSSSFKTLNGKPRKYYETTERGKLVLQESRPRIRELVDEVLEERRL